MTFPQPKDHWFHTPRLWTYSRKHWDPNWWNKAGIPTLAADEWGRRTIVWGTALTGYIVWAWKTCWCDECHIGRAETYTYALEHWKERQDKIDRGQCLCINDHVHKEWSHIEKGEPSPGLVMRSPCPDCGHLLRHHDQWGNCTHVDESMRLVKSHLPENLEIPLPEDAT